MQNTFLLTYRSFITPHQLLDLLIQRYSMPLPEGNEASVNAFKASHQKPIQLKYNCSSLFPFPNLQRY